METRSASYYHHIDPPSRLMLLMEDSGDSSELADLCSNSTRLHLPDDDDDAESCSWDSSEQCSRKRELDSISGHCNKKEKKARKEEEEEDYQERWTSVGLMVKQKSCVSEESKANELLLTEVERNRLFWEACLAS